MGDMPQTSRTDRATRGLAWAAILGAALSVLAVGGFVWLAGRGEDNSLPDVAQWVTETPTAAWTASPAPYVPDVVTPTRPAEALVERQVIAPPTRTPTPTPTPTLTATPIPNETPTPEPRPTDPPEPPVEIDWTQEEKNALSWLCYGEVGGMGVTAVDACLSVLSTVRVRYLRASSGGSSSIVDIITAPGQFNVRIETAYPSPSEAMNQAVEQYVAGLRGSCSGYYFFDSAPPQPGACVIYGYGGQWVRFYNR